MPKTTKPRNNNSTLEKIMWVERRIHATKGDIEGLFESYVCDLILLRELRATLAIDMVTSAFPKSRGNKTETLNENPNAG